MRDPGRIEPIIQRLWEVWQANPDLRLGQLLVNLVRPPEPCPAVFYIEDEKLLSHLLNPAALAAAGLKNPADTDNGP